MNCITSSARVLRRIIDIKHQITAIYLLITRQLLVLLLNINEQIHTSLPARRPYPIPKNRKIEILDEEWARTNTRFNKEDLKKLFLYLPIPGSFRTEHNGCVIDGESVLLLSMVHIAQGIPIHQLPDKFSGDPREFGFFFREFCDHIYSTFFHRISGDSLMFYANRIDSYRR